MSDDPCVHAFSECPICSRPQESTQWCDECNKRQDEIERLRSALRDIYDLVQSMEGFGSVDEEEYEATLKRAKEALGE